MIIVLDVWGGEQSQLHLARKVLPIEQALERARIELAAGYLVNLRREVAWGSFQDFDLRN